MPDITVGSGNTKTIINEEQAAMLREEDFRHAILHVTSNAIRLAPAAQIQDESEARHGLDIAAGAYVTGFKPFGHEIIAYGDGSGDSTVHVHLVTERTFTIADVDV